MIILTGMEAEAHLVVLVYALLATVVLCFSLITFGYIWVKGYVLETREFIRLMIELYEKEKEIRRDEP